ncbi:MAG: protein-L-isoaspartate O-methyltransferase [Parcubacteria group bacterium RIFCSPLOWO2_12_FULL_40_10]|nr:MAG: protein-L-isoaspartate O-methyltransferase [Parcubacteria group bacterium RIFCSPHIGHO2_02_FULL_40_12]OHB23977.1 MAG: protein-L-isoaspartate O-methyltransferase [Parcubacteria group bacterium RIFCSPLOWO2_12_FULL_40_10]
MNSNSELIQKLIFDKILITPQIIDAFEAVDRKDFVSPDDQDRAYEDRPLPIGYGATISQPTTVAIMLEKLFEGDTSISLGASKILEIGTGSGYMTALLAKIAGENGSVFSVEYISELKEFAESNFKKYNFRNISLFVGDGKVGLKDYVPFDKIISSASGDEIPKAWREQAGIGGRIVVPIAQDLVVLEKLSKRKFKEEKIPGFVFIPLQ